MAIKDAAPATTNTNEVVPDLVATVYKQNLEALDKTFRQFHVRPNSYAFFQEEDNRICLKYENGEWLTLISERGEAFNVFRFGDVDSACLFMIKEIAESKIEANQMIMYYKSQMDNSELLK